MAYIGKGLDNGVRNQFIFAATQGQTSFSGADSDGKTLAMTDILYTDCYQNGVKLKPTTDYTVSLTTLTLISAASLNDVINIVAFDIFGVPDTVPASTGGTFNGGIGATTGTFTGNLASTSSGVITNSLITSSTNQYAEQLFQDGNAGYALQIRSDNAQSTGTGSFLINDRDTGSFPVVIKEGNASNTLVLSGSKVGIGTTSPAHNLEIVSTASGSVNDTLQIRNNATASGTGSRIRFINSTDATSDTNGASIASVRTGDDNDLRFETENAERMRILAAGDVEIGDFVTDGSATGVLFGVGGGASAPEIQSSAQGTNDRFHYEFYNDNGKVGGIKTNGSSTSYNTSSDYRLKESVDYTWDATTRLKQLKPARFNFITDDTNTPVDGFLAHEVSSIVPEAISGTKDAMTTEVLYVEGDELPDGKSIGDVKEASVPDYQGIDQSKLVPLLVKTIQELEARITALEAE